MGESAPLRLATHGLSGKDLTVLRSLLALYRDRPRCELHLHSDHDRADVHLIDVDQPAGRARWEALRERSRCIVFSRDAVDTTLYRSGLIAQDLPSPRFTAQGFTFGGRDLVARLRQRLGL